MGLFFWPNILKLDFKERKLVLEVTDGDTEDNTEPTKHKFVFLLDNSKACKHLWKCAVEHHTFFRLNNPVNVADQKKTFIRVGSRFRPSFRTEVQLRRGASERRSVPVSYVQLKQATVFNFFFPVRAQTFSAIFT